MVGAANRYVDEQAPWALRKTDPDRMAAVLYVLAETIRHIAIVTQPVMPEVDGRLLDQLAVPADQRDFAASGQPAPAGHAAAQAGGRLPAPRRGRGRPVESPLVDSHCHLDYLAKDGDLEEVVARAGRRRVEPW